MPKIYSRTKIRIPNIFANVKNKRKLAMITIFITAIVISAKVMLNAVNPIFDTLCENEAKSLATIISNEQATNVMTEHSYDELFTIEKDTNGNVTMINSNVIPINEIISDVFIDYKKMDLEQFVTDQPVLKSYMKDGKLTVEGIKSIYTSMGATCG